MRLAIAALCIGSIACGTKQPTPQTSGATVTLSATLVRGAATFTPARDESGPLVGYVLSCATYSAPAVSGQGTSDGLGNVTLTLAANSVPFGCFVLDASSNVVAVVLFNSGTSTSHAATLGGDTSLGTITVDATAGVALAPLATGIVAQIGGTTCPVGQWASVAATGACGVEQIAVGVLQTGASGAYFVAFTDGPQTVATNSCGFTSQNSDAGSYDGNNLTFSVADTSRPTCNSHVTFTLTPNSSCSVGTLVCALDNCGPCHTGECECDGCGTNTCTATLTGFQR